MKKKKMLALLMGASLVLAACGGGDDTKDTAGGANPDPEKLYSQKCSSCHAADLKGGVGPDLTKVGSKLSKDEIEKVILEGRGNMPKGQLTGADATTVAEWLAEKK
jgi:cytochrome c551